MLQKQCTRQDTERTCCADTGARTGMASAELLPVLPLLVPLSIFLPVALLSALPGRGCTRCGWTSQWCSPPSTQPSDKLLPQLQTPLFSLYWSHWLSPQYSLISPLMESSFPTNCLFWLEPLHFICTNITKRILKLIMTKQTPVLILSIVWASDDRDLVLSDQMLPTSCTSQSSCTVEPHTTYIFTNHDRAMSVRCARNVTRHAHSLCYRENLQCELNQSTNVDHPDVRDIQSNCGQVCGGGSGKRAGMGHDRSLHNAFSTKITTNLDNGHL